MQFVAGQKNTVYLSSQFTFFRLKDTTLSDYFHAGVITSCLCFASYYFSFVLILFFRKQSAKIGITDSHLAQQRSSKFIHFPFLTGITELPILYEASSYFNHYSFFGVGKVVVNWIKMKLKNEFILLDSLADLDKMENTPLMQQKQHWHTGQMKVLLGFNLLLQREASWVLLERSSWGLFSSWQQFVCFFSIGTITWKWRCVNNRTSTFHFGESYCMLL